MKRTLFSKKYAATLATITAFENKILETKLIKLFIAVSSSVISDEILSNVFKGIDKVIK